MMRTDRRSVLKGTAVLGAAGAVPLAVSAARAAQPPLVVFDSRIPESASFAANHPSPRRIDLATAHETRWAALRRELPQAGAVEGLTGWSDWIAARGALEAHGLRLSAEAPVVAPLSGKAHLFRWAMKTR